MIVLIHEIKTSNYIVSNSLQTGLPITECCYRPPSLTHEEITAFTKQCCQALHKDEKEGAHNSCEDSLSYSSGHSFSASVALYAESDLPLPSKARSPLQRQQLCARCRPTEGDGRRSLTHAGATLWNGLPDELRCPMCFLTFKENPKAVLFRKFYPPWSSMLCFRRIRVETEFAWYILLTK